MITFKPFILISAVLALSACSTAKLEARLEANPQCKDVVNPKTGALMPCPGSDKAFYASVGLAPPAKPSSATNKESSTSPSTQTYGTPSASTQAAPKSASNTTSSTAPATAPTDCKPQIHKKTGGTLPCPAAD